MRPAQSDALRCREASGHAGPPGPEASRAPSVLVESSGNDTAMRACPGPTPRIRAMSHVQNLSRHPDERGGAACRASNDPPQGSLRGSAQPRQTPWDAEKARRDGLPTAARVDKSCDQPRPVRRNPSKRTDSALHRGPVFGYIRPASGRGEAPSSGHPRRPWRTGGDVVSRQPKKIEVDPP